MKANYTHTTIGTRESSKAAISSITYLQVVQHLRPGGIEALALDLLSDDPGTGEARVLSLEGDRDRALSDWPRLNRISSRVHWLGKSPGLEPSLVVKLVRFFKAHRVQVVHTHHIGPLLYAGIAARLAGVPVLIHTEHDAWHLQSLKRRWLQRSVLALTRPKLVADAAQVANNMVRFLGHRKINVIRNGVDCDRFRPGDSIVARTKLKLPQQVKLIGTSGRLEPVKGQRYLIEALALMPTDYHLAVAGDGSQADFLAGLASRKGVSERVHLLGHLDDMPSFYQALDLFCLPSLNEGFPLSSLEAQACSVIAAVTDVGASRETLCPSTGLLLQPETVDSMAKSLINAFTEPRNTDPRDFVIRTADLNQTKAAYGALAGLRST